MPPWFIRPRYHGHEAFTGVFLLDSFGVAKHDDGKRHWYVADVLQFVWWRTGLVCCAVEYDGAGYEGLMECARKVRDMASSMQSSMMKFGVIISTGNDVYRRGCSSPDHMEKVVGGMYAVDAHMRRHCVSSTLVVFGGASAIWKYDKQFGPSYAQSYEAAVAEVTLQLRLRYGIEVIRGTSLVVVTTAIRIGHLHVLSLPAVANVYALWARIAAGQPLGCSLSPGARL